MNISILLYEGVTALDVVGPYEVLSRLPRAHVEFVAARPGPVRTDSGFLDLVATTAFGESSPADVLLVPGGADGTRRAAADTALLAWIREMHEQTRFTASVCTGALILGASGLLRDKRATTHWSDRAELEAYGVQVVDRRIVESGKILTSAGVSAGIDLALALAERLTDRRVAEAIQLVLEYDPDPPFAAGSPRRARAETVALAHEMMKTRRLTEEGRSSIRALNDEE